MQVKVDEKLISYLEEISLFTLTDEEKTRLIPDLQKTLDEMICLDELDTSDDPGEKSCNGNENPLCINIFREDVVEKPLSRKWILYNAPVKNEEAFIAPKTVGEQ